MTFKPIMRQAQLIAATTASVALTFTGWGTFWLTDLMLIIGGVFAGHVLTELLNDPSE